MVRTQMLSLQVCIMSNTLKTLFPLTLILEGIISVYCSEISHHTYVRMCVAWLPTPVVSMFSSATTRCDDNDM